MDPSEAKRFAVTVFGDALDAGLYVATWAHPSQASAFHQTADNVATWAMRAAAEGQNVYIGMGVFAAPPTSGRGRAEDVAAICALWADLDVLHPAHKKLNLPPDEAAALGLLDRMGLPPSAIVRSGHGLQAYWLFREPWVFDSAGERAEAAALSRRWVATLRATAKVHGWDADPVGDLARVLRIPGTANVKDPAAPVPVTMIPLAANPARYNPSDFDMYLVPEELEPDRVTVAVAEVQPVALAAGASPPATKLAAMIQNDPKFAATWGRKRKDFQDQSASAYDMALANIAAAAGWTDQEITDLILAWRRDHGENVQKALRQDYIMRTLAKARTSLQSTDALNRVLNESPLPTGGGPIAGPAVGPAGGPMAAAADNGITPDQRRAWLATIAKGIQVPMVRWIQHGNEPGRTLYSMVLQGGREVLVGNSSALFNVNTMRTIFYDACGVVVKEIKRKDWHTICQLLARIAEFVPNEEANRGEQTLEWLGQYLRRSAVHTGNDGKKNALRNSDPFIEAGEVYIYVPTFMRFLQVSLLQKGLRDEELWDRMRLVGFCRRVVGCRVDGETLTRSYWHAPMDALRRTTPDLDDSPEGGPTVGATGTAGGGAAEADDGPPDPF